MSGALSGVCVSHSTAPAAQKHSPRILGPRQPLVSLDPIILQSLVRHSFADLTVGRELSAGAFARGAPAAADRSCWYQVQNKPSSPLWTLLTTNNLSASAVFEATHSQLGRVAFKCLLPHYAADPLESDAFLHEAELMARCSHRFEVQGGSIPALHLLLTCCLLSAWDAP